MPSARTRLGRDAAIVGECVAERPGFVILDTGLWEPIVGRGGG